MSMSIKDALVNANHGKGQKLIIQAQRAKWDRQRQLMAQHYAEQQAALRAFEQRFNTVRDLVRSVLVRNIPAPRSPRPDLYKACDQACRAIARDPVHFTQVINDLKWTWVSDATRKVSMKHLQLV